MKRAFTLIEILVSLAITLMMMGAVVALFGVMTDSVSGSRSIIEMTERLRSCRNRLQTDLQGVTVGINSGGLRPPLRPENDEGYFELIEGPDSDLNYASSATLSMFGDADDVLMFTVRSGAEPFVGKFAFGSGTAESQTAEVMYFAMANGQTIVLSGGGTQQLYTLYRRVLLVSPGLKASLTGTSLNSTFYNFNDVSVHTDPTGIAIPNTLGDLTKRENRFAHFTIPPAAAAIFPFNVLSTAGSNATLTALTGVRLGDDVLMTNVLAFDVQVYDPFAPIRVTTTNPTALIHSDVGFGSAPAATAFGAYINIGYTYTPGGSDPVPLFNLIARRSVTPGVNILLAPTLPVAGVPAFTYDTWSLHYENDGILQNTSNATADLGTNGLDDNSNGIVDDMAEFDTQAPFPGQLRGIKITIRAYEPGSQQVRQVEVIQDFLPE